jgi:hypothetical protein
VLLAVLPLPAESVNALPATEIDAVPVELAVGVKVAVYDVPEPEKDDNVPPETVTSPTTKSEEDSDNVNVIVSVWLAFNVPDPVRAIAMVGTTESIDRLSAELHDVLALPAASTTALGPTHRAAVPLAVFAVGVNVAVYVEPEPERFDKVPLVADDGQRCTSASSNPVTGSLKVNVIVSVWPARIVPDPDRVGIVIDGAVVSRVIVVLAAVIDEGPELPAASKAPFAANRGVTVPVLHPETVTVKLEPDEELGENEHPVAVPVQVKSPDATSVTDSENCKLYVKVNAFVAD